MPDAETPQFRVSNERDPIPPVDPEDLKRRWKIQPGDKDGFIGERIREVDSSAILHRDEMIRMLTKYFNKGQLLAPWQHGAELDDAVFRVAGTFPIRPLRQNVYKVPGDSVWEFDPNAFVQKLIEETGISHTWKPVPARISEGNWYYVTHRLNNGPPDPEREAKHLAGELLWAVWGKCQPYLNRPSRNDELDVAVVLFADFVIDNIGLAREFVSGMSGGEGRSPLVILSELERRALRSPWE